MTDEQAADYICGQIDDFLCDGKFDLCNEFIKNLEIDSAEVIISCLSFLYRARYSLPEYKNFLERCRLELYKKMSKERADILINKRGI